MIFNCFFIAVLIIIAVRQIKKNLRKISLNRRHENGGVDHSKLRDKTNRLKNEKMKK